MFSMQILHLKNVIFKINFEDCKDHFWRFILKIYFMVTLQMALHVFSPHWRSILKIIIFRSSKKIFNFFFFFLIFFFKFFFTFSKSSEWIFKMILEKKKLSAVRLEPGTLGLLVLHSATLLPGSVWKRGKMKEYIIICVFWWWL